MVLSAIWDEDRFSVDRRREWLRAALCAGIFALPILVRLALLPPAPAVDGPTWVESLKAWYPFHYFPESWPAGKWVLALSYLFLYGVLTVQAPEALRKKVLPLLFASLIVVAGAFAARASGIPGLIRLQFFRADVFLILLGTLLTAERAIRLFEGEGLTEALLGGLLVGTVTVWFCWPLALVAGAGLTLKRGTVRFPIPWLLYWGVVLAAAVWSLNRMGDGDSGIFPAGPALAMMVLTPLMFLPPKPIPPRTLRGISAGLLLLAFLPLLFLMKIHLETGSLTNSDANMGRMEREWIKISRWSREHTPPGSLFLVPPEMWSFRVFAERPVVFQWVDGAAIHWNPSYVTTWRRGLKDLHGSIEAMNEQWAVVGRNRYPLLIPVTRAKNPASPLERNYDALTASDFNTLHERYGWQFLITMADAPVLPYSLLVNGEIFRLYAYKEK